MRLFGKNAFKTLPSSSSEPNARGDGRDGDVDGARSLKRPITSDLPPRWEAQEALCAGHDNHAHTHHGHSHGQEGCQGCIHHRPPPVVRFTETSFVNLTLNLTVNVNASLDVPPPSVEEQREEGDRGTPGDGEPLQQKKKEERREIRIRVHAYAGKVFLEGRPEVHVHGRHFSAAALGPVLSSLVLLEKETGVQKEGGEGWTGGERDEMSRMKLNVKALRVTEFSGQDGVTVLSSLCSFLGDPSPLLSRLVVLEISELSLPPCLPAQSGLMVQSQENNSVLLLKRLLGLLVESQKEKEGREREKGRGVLRFLLMQRVSVPLPSLPGLSEDMPVPRKDSEGVSWIGAVEDELVALSEGIQTLALGWNVLPPLAGGRGGRRERLEEKREAEGGLTSSRLLERILRPGGTGVENLRLEGCGLRGADVRRLCTAAAVPPSSCGPSPSVLVETQHSWQNLRGGGTEVRDTPGIDARSSFDGWTCRLKLLDLSENILGEEGADALAKLLVLPSVRLQTLRLHRCGLGIGGVLRLLSAVCVGGEGDQDTQVLSVRGDLRTVGSETEEGSGCREGSAGVEGSADVDLILQGLRERDTEMETGGDIERDQPGEGE
eukprot:Cvel_17438.t1-p1 / transcript=Cvel_17438.t1 / gene=Cvel_17438 / organism=Chromera_velia_CCMP2878 / gene_product=hypothetical protein / transcript_product=hypothetical protein / location=Cvel_scaffold1390:43486-47744(+) / protein_length=605 / sequence_SO=supercontig / SO=protein_coding / is_pseudo=false